MSEYVSDRMLEKMPEWGRSLEEIKKLSLVFRIHSEQAG